MAFLPRKPCVPGTAQQREWKTIVTDDKMAIDHIRYDILARDALRGVLRQVLTDAAARGLPGDHHFLVTFNTGADGVKISPRLSAQYPDDLTIVLQHQFWDLRVTDSAFEVGLSFNGIPERLVVPFDAIKSFFDPSVQFGLQFETAGNEEDEDEAQETDAAEEIVLPVANAKREAADSANDAAAKAADPAQPSQGAEVVRLDRFRKK